MLVDKVIKYYDKEYDLNCAECMLVAANEEYNLDVSKESLKLMSAFGGGLGIGSVCGAITGGSAVLGLMFTEERGHLSPHVKMMNIEFISKFHEEMGMKDCLPLKAEYFHEKDRCLKMMIAAAKSLEEVINKYKEKYI